MATRFYLSSTATSSLTPSYAAWSRTTEGDRYEMNPTKDSSARTAKTMWANGSAAANNTALARQYIGPTMAPGVSFSTSDTFNCVIMCHESATNDNINRQPICIKVVSEDGTTLRATLKSLAHYGPNTTEWGIATQSENLSAVAGTALGANYTTVAGDRLVIEVGSQVSGSAGTTVTGTMYFGSASATDHSTTEHNTNVYNPWFELSTTITFGNGFEPTSQLLTTGRGNVTLDIITSHNENITGQAFAFDIASIVKTDTSIGLSGFSLTSAIGSLVTTITSAVSLVGQPLTLAQQAVTENFDFSHAIVGQALTSAQGDVVAASSASHNENLTGQALTISQGGISYRVDWSEPITGQALTLAQGTTTQTATGNHNENLSGFQLTFDITSVVNTDISIGVSGFSVSSAQGSVVAVVGDSYTLGTQLVSIAQGSVTQKNDWSHSLGTSLLTLAQGVVSASSSANHNENLTGQALTVGQGLLSYKNDWSAGVLGQALTLAQGTTTQQFSGGHDENISGFQLTFDITSVVNTDVSIGIGGFGLSLSQGSVSVPQGVLENITGQALTLAQGTVSAGAVGGDHNENIAGQALTLAQNTIIRNDLSHTLDGQALTLDAASIVKTDVSVGIGGLSLSLSRGNFYYINGSDNIFSAATQALTSAQGTVSFLDGGVVAQNITGQVLTLRQANYTYFSLTEEPTGQALTANQGSQDLIFHPSQPGIFSVPLVLNQGALFAGPAQSVSLTGQAGTLAQGSVSINNDNAVFLSGLSLTTSQGVVSFEGDYAVAISGLPLSLSQSTVLTENQENYIAVSQLLSLSQGTVSVSVGVNAIELIGFDLFLNQNPVLYLEGPDNIVTLTGFSLVLGTEDVCFAIHEIEPDPGTGFTPEVGATTIYILENEASTTYESEDC